LRWASLHTSCASRSPSKRISSAASTLRKRARGSLSRATSVSTSSSLTCLNRRKLSAPLSARTRSPPSRVRVRKVSPGGESTSSSASLGRRRRKDNSSATSSRGRINAHMLLHRMGQRRTGASQLDLFLAASLPVKAQEHTLIVVAGDHVHRTLPDGVQADQGLAGLGALQILSIVPVRQEELAAVLVIGIHHFDDGLAEVGQLLQQLVLHLLELPGGDLPGRTLLVEAIGEQLLFDAEFRRQEGVDEGDVVVVAADLEDLLPPLAGLPIPVAALLVGVALLPLLAEAPLVPAVLDVAEQLDPELV